MRRNKLLVLKERERGVIYNFAAPKHEIPTSAALEKNSPVGWGNKAGANYAVAAVPKHKYDDPPSNRRRRRPRRIHAPRVSDTLGGFLSGETAEAFKSPATLA